MKLGMIVGGLVAALGLALIVIAAVAVNGPLFYWAEPLAADAAQRRCLIAGVAALLLGGAAIVSTRRRASR